MTNQSRERLEEIEDLIRQLDCLRKKKQLELDDCVLVLRTIKFLQKQLEAAE